MPFRQKLKKARDFVRDAFSNQGDSRPSTPNSLRLYTSSPVGDTQQPGNPGAPMPSSQPRPQVLAGPPGHSPGAVPDVTLTKWKGPQEFARVLGQVTNIFGPVKEMVDMFIGCIDMYEMAESAQTEYTALQVQVGGLLEDLSGYFKGGSSLTMTKSMESICESIKVELEKIQSKLGRNVGVRYIEARDEVDIILGCYRHIELHLTRLSLNANLEMWKVVEEQTADSRTERMSVRVGWLSPSLPAWYNSAEGIELKRRACTPGTRVDVIANILDWTRSSGGGAVYWLNGMAGTGKTTISYSVCAELDAAHQLGASFFCSRLREECRNVNRIIPSIAYQLARFSRPFQSALTAELEKDPDVHGRLPHMQFDALIAKPILKVQHTLPDGLVVVIDALDECEQKESTGRMLDVLLSKSGILPIRFIVSSRPESQIRDQMTDERAKSRLVLHEMDKGEVQGDIEKYLREGLAYMAPSDTHIKALVERAGILFIYPATAVRYISYDNFSRNPGARLRTILDTTRTQGATKHEEIDQLYATVLGAALDDRGLEPAERDDMHQVLHTVICAREPLTIGGISELLQIEDAERVRSALRPLWSVLHIVGASELVTTLHASFPDFMFDPARSKAYHCNSDDHNRKMAEHCFELIKRTEPQFNICGLESSYLPDESVPNIEQQVAKAISPELLYACRFWADHVDTGKGAPALVELLQDFLSARLLLWMEILNVNKQMNAGMECMKTMVKWCDQFEAHRELVELADDAKRFVEAFASNPVSQATPHIYISMLTFWPRSAPIAKQYAQYTYGPVKAEGTALNRRQLAHLATWAFDAKIAAMAVSPDGLSVALGIGNDVHVVDSSSGRVVVGPLKGHEKEVKSIAFSPDGTRVLAGSTNYLPHYATILGWNTRTGHAILGPLRLERHTDFIECLSFSPDCARIATGAEDKTVCLWDAETGNILHCLATTNDVYKSVFSPDGTRIAASTSGRSGGALQVWDSQTGDTILGPLTDVHPVTNIAFSHDQSRIICGGGRHNGKAIYVRDAQSGDMILGPMKGHTVGIACIGCSPDGRLIVSGSWDRTVRLWDAQNGNMVLGPLEAHTSSITSVTFSPDGSSIISACENGLVCTWDARQQNFPSRSSNTPFGRITCVKFSSDGAQFVSGSYIGTICIWDSHTGEMKPGPIKAHTCPINAVDFLNDRVVSGSDDGSICICDAPSGEVVLGPLEVHPGGTIEAIAYSPNGKYIATGSGNKIGLWDAQTGSRVLDPLTGIKAPVVSIQFSPDGTRIVGGSNQFVDSEMVTWEVPDGKALSGAFSGPTEPVLSVSYSPDGALIASGHADRTIIIWDAYTGKKALGPLTGHSGWVCSVDFSPDSTRLVSGSSDGTIRIWDVQTGETLFEILNGHEDWVESVAYSPDGDRILSYSYDMSVHIHDARSPKEMALSGSVSELGEWTINKDGWVVDDQSRLLVWVPGDLRKALGRSRTLVIVPHGNVHLKFDKSCLGESWAQSYASRL